MDARCPHRMLACDGDGIESMRNAIKRCVGASLHRRASRRSESSRCASSLPRDGRAAGPRHDAIARRRIADKGPRWWADERGRAGSHRDGSTLAAGARAVVRERGALPAMPCFMRVSGRWAVRRCARMRGMRALCKRVRTRRETVPCAMPKRASDGVSMRAIAGRRHALAGIESRLAIGRKTDAQQRLVSMRTRCQTQHRSRRVDAPFFLNFFLNIVDQTNYDSP